MSRLVERLSQVKIVAIIRGIPKQFGDPAAEALANGGIAFLEVTMNTDGACEMISLFRKKYGGKLCIGAGTVLNLDMAKQAVSAGAEYLISPNLNEEVVRFGVQQGLDVWPGVMTPTEIERAYQTGATAVKVFPIGTLGVNYLNEIRAPLNHVPMIATGGVTLRSAQSCIQAGAIAVGLGGYLVDKNLIQQRKFKELEELAAKFVACTKGVPLV